MRRLFAPWRIAYIENAKAYGFLFCQSPKEDPSKDPENLLLHRGRLAFVLLNRFPYNPGHLMIAPYRHIKLLSELTPEEAAEIWELASRAERAVVRAFKPDGFNWGINVGKPAGAGFEHLHLHLVPRWQGDTNFMPVLGDVKVVVEDLKRSYEKLREAWE